MSLHASAAHVFCLVSVFQCCSHHPFAWAQTLLHSMAFSEHTDCAVLSIGTTQFSKIPKAWWPGVPTLSELQLIKGQDKERKSCAWDTTQARDEEQGDVRRGEWEGQNPVYTPSLVPVPPGGWMRFGVWYNSRRNHEAHQNVSSHLSDCI